MTPVAAGLLAASLAMSGAYLFRFVRQPASLLRSAVKTLAMLTLTVFTAMLGGPDLLILALALSALGDLFISRDGERAFLAGLGSFLLAHVAYVALFWAVAEGASPLFAILFAIYALAMMRWLWPHLEAMKAPVLAYIAVIYAMGVTAFAAPAHLWPLTVGATLFILSDSVLSAETFVFRDAPRAWTAPVIWSTYYAAQVLIAAAFLYPLL